MPEIERRILEFWQAGRFFEQLVEKNRGNKRFSFLDGPITANGPFGVHHAWGRTYKDLFQRFKAMQGYDQRYVNGFDCQGLWVEVMLERELGFNSKREIEAYGIDRFVEKCKERVRNFADLITQQSIRYGQWMHWDQSYYTMSDENNYTIWLFLKKCHERGLIYRGHDVMPWCARCGAAMSDMEIATEGYKELTHPAVYLRFPIREKPGEYLLIWTTTPWTLTSNVAVAVHPEMRYVRVEENGAIYYVAKSRTMVMKGNPEVREELAGEKLVGLTYDGPFDELPAQQGITHRVVAWDEVSETDGTGMVHIAPGCGKEDFRLGHQEGLAVVAPLDESGIFLDGFAWLTGKDVKDVVQPIFQDLERKGQLYRTEQFTHRYPVCWRCGSELVFRLVDEWFIRMDELRYQIMENAKQVRWIPEFGRERELDWLHNMADWCISKKRYWGLALPIFECACGHFDVVGGRDELKARAITGWEKFEGHSPHRPWVDEIRIQCPKCLGTAARVPDVGNPWLDAGIVPYSTMGYSDRAYWEKWFPADFITECFPGQYRNWFYVILTMSTVLENRAPFRVLLGHASVLDEQGEEMHTSKGNAIEVAAAVEQMGADTMRWMFTAQNPALDVRFGYGRGQEVHRKLLTFWNVYSFFTTYARIDGFDPLASKPLREDRTVLDRWILSRLNGLIRFVTERLEDYDPAPVPREVERFVDDLSVWYVRRSRRRFWKSSEDKDKLVAYHTLYQCLVEVTRLIAPIMPFLAEELYQNLVVVVDDSAPKSVHLDSYPVVAAEARDERLESEMALVRRLVSLGHAAREKAKVKVRQPLSSVFIRLATGHEYGMLDAYRDVIREELNVKRVEYAGIAHEPPAVESSDYVAETDREHLVAVNTTLTPELRHEGLARELVRRIQNLRKEAGFDVADRIRVNYTASRGLERAIHEFQNYVREEVLATELTGEGELPGERTKEFKFDGERVKVTIARMSNR
jgi:isoleucyl-tRNA synthetase